VTGIRRRLLIDLRPLRASPAFRRLLIGSSLSQIGSQLTTFAVALQVYQITHSSAAVGGVGLAAAGPAIVVGLLSGSLIDAVDRRKLVLVTSTCLAAVSTAFAIQAFAGAHSVWLLYGLVAVEYSFVAVNGPARRTFMPRLLGVGLIPAGASLTMLSMHISLVIGPAVGGLLAGAGGLKLCYLIDAISFAGALYGVVRLPAMRPEGTAAKVGVKAAVDGFRFITDSKALLGTLLSDLSATALAMPIALFPAINAERFGGSPRTLGLLTTALAVGGIIGTAFSGPVSHITRPGRAMTVAVTVWGCSLIGFGLAGPFWLTFAFLVTAGTADVLSVVFRTSIVQTVTPDRYRGRVSSAEFVVGGAAPQIGNFRAGVLASLTSPGASATIGGASCLGGAALIAVTLPAFFHLAPTKLAADAPEPVPDPVS
jgi:MFS family permease